MNSVQVGQIMLIVLTIFYNLHVFLLEYCESNVVCISLYDDNWRSFVN